MTRAFSFSALCACAAGALVLIAMLPPVAAAGDRWPGSPPDCWSEPRVVHSASDPVEAYWRKHTRIATRPYAGLRPGKLSPNKAYFFVANEYPPDVKITIYAEKDHLVEIGFSDLRWLSNVRWINEKLIFWRVWWGQIAATDMIYDVEAEKLIYTESASDAKIAWQQYRESCPRLGCDCIKKR